MQKTPVEQLADDLAKVAMNMTPVQRAAFYHAINQASANWIAQHSKAA